MLIYDAPFNPPITLRIAGYVILAEFIVIVVLIVALQRLGIESDLVKVVGFVINSIACVFLGIAAKRLGKSWLLYGVLPAIGIIFPFALFSLYKLWSDARFKWLDDHATYIDDRA